MPSGEDARPQADTVPYRAERVDACPVQEDIVLHCPDLELTASLNRSAAAIWQRCDGSRTIAQISAEFARELHLPAEALLPDVLDAVARLGDLGLLLWEHSYRAGAPAG